MFQKVVKAPKRGIVSVFRTGLALCAYFVICWYRSRSDLVHLDDVIWRSR